MTKGTLGVVVSAEGPIAARVEQSIVRLRGHRVMVDETLAELYGVSVKALNQAVKRNPERFPDDFMFQLKADEAAALRSQIVTSKPSGRGGGRYQPYAFTEQGVAMLRGARAAQVNVEIMRAFVRLRRLLQEHADLAAKLERLEKKYDGQFRIVFDAIRDLMRPPVKPVRRIGFKPEGES